MGSPILTPQAVMPMQLPLHPTGEFWHAETSISFVSLPQGKHQQPPWVNSNLCQLNTWCKSMLTCAGPGKGLGFDRYCCCQRCLSWAWSTHPYPISFPLCPPCSTSTLPPSPCMALLASFLHGPDCFLLASMFACCSLTVHATSVAFATATKHIMLVEHTFRWHNTPIGFGHYLCYKNVTVKDYTICQVAERQF